MALLKEYLVAHYKMNDNLATNVIIDETGSHNGTVEDATGTATSAFHSVAGKINLAQNFDGVDDYMDFGSAGNLDITGNFTIGAWVKKIADAGSYPDVIGKLDVVRGYGLYVNNTTGIAGIMGNGAALKVTAAHTPTNGVWYFYVVVYDTTAQTLTLYVDGVFHNSVDTTGVIASTINNLRMGRHFTDWATFGYFNGHIDNVMIFNRALTPLEISYLYNGGMGRENISVGFELSRTGQRLSSFPEN